MNSRYLSIGNVMCKSDADWFELCWNRKRGDSGVQHEWEKHDKRHQRKSKTAQNHQKLLEKHRQAEVDSFLCLLLRLHFSSVYISWKAKK